ncbi:DUF4397 domain-containing protein [Chitinophaga nivalis]|uniref:DUF4397 domain-containing protein n=1 Tax=Chitinophaga nivalis TaxID=2991709 RepID=A0ABT3IU32_9BACT|nr:DUF4397 domain-containing protein [Chitinophaga nivalis]MCW3462818.1 DUF4397 domain-containing protein [Chitinophaga nivalis]MCW3487492.1 DUF4397 domain-containing protein [Chitinophaga nivalis]
MQKRALLFLAALVMLLNACKKGDLPTELYYGKIAIFQLPFSDAPELDVFYDGKKLGKIVSDQDFVFTLPAATNSAKLSVFKANTTVLVADTLVKIEKNNTKSFRVISTESLGLHGFISGAKVAPDSSKVQFMLNLKKTFNDYPVVDLHIYTGKGRPLTLTDVTILKNVKNGVLDAQTLMLPCFTEDGSNISYYFKIKDLKTGEFVVLPTNKIRNGAYPFLNTGTEQFRGHYSIVSITDREGETLDENYISAELTTF